MQVLRRRIRSFFALQGVLLLLIGLDTVLRPIHTLRPIPPLRHYGILAAYLLLSVVSAMAWWTTRKPSAQRNPWAIVASLTALVTGLFYLWMQHSKLEFAGTGLLVAAIGAAGLYLFAQSDESPTYISLSETPRERVAAKKSPPQPTSVPGDRTHPGVNLLAAAFALFAEGTAIFYWSIWARGHALAHAGGLPWFLLFTFAILISTFVHECGHAFFAWGCYMKLLSFNAGPLKWRKRDEHWQLKFDPVGFLSLGGAVQVIPTNSRQPPAHEFWTLAAGPLANVIAGQILIWMVLDHTLPLYAHTWKLAAFTASFCYIAAITNLLPFMTEGGGYSDGARILQILTKSPLNDYHRTVNSIAATLVTNRRYRDLDAHAIEQAAARFPREFQGLHLRLWAVNVYQDSGQLPEARAALAAAEAIYDNSSPSLPVSDHLAFVIGHAWLNRDATAARLWWDRMEDKGSVRQNVDYFLAQAALLWTEGQPEQAEEAWQKADALAQKLPQFGAGDFDRDRCANLRKELANSSPAPVVRTAATPVKASAALTPAPAPAAPIPAAPAPAAAVAASVPEVDIFTRIRGLAPTPAAVPTVVASAAEAEIAAGISAPTPPATPAVSTPVVEIAARIQAVSPPAEPTPAPAIFEASETLEPSALSLPAPTEAIAETPALRQEVSPEPEPLVVAVEESLPTAVAFAQEEDATASQPTTDETDDAIHAWLRKIASEANAQAAAEDAIPAAVSARTRRFDATPQLPREPDPGQPDLDETQVEAHDEIHTWLRKITSAAEPPIPAGQPMPVPAFTQVDASSVDLQPSASAAAETPVWLNVVAPESETSIAPEEPFPAVAEDPIPVPAFAEATAFPIEIERPARALGSVTRIPMSPRTPAPEPVDKPRFDPLDFLRPAAGSRG